MAISNAFVQLHRRSLGKGPTKAKTFVLDDMVLCVLEGGELPFEKTLRERGNGTLVHEVRDALHAAVRDECRAIIERARPAAASRPCSHSSIPTRTSNARSSSSTRRESCQRQRAASGRWPGGATGSATAWA
jgi:hypothetical protein